MQRSVLIHPKAMPVILTQPEEIEIWLLRSLAKAAALQTPLVDGALQIVARGKKQDGRPQRPSFLKMS